jgi:hypothetical protein
MPIIIQVLKNYFLFGVLLFGALWFGSISAGNNYGIMKEWLGDGWLQKVMHFQS